MLLPNFCQFIPADSIDPQLISQFNKLSVTPFVKFRISAVIDDQELWRERLAVCEDHKL